MRRLGIGLALGAILAVASANAEVPKQLVPFEFLVGEWQASGTGSPGEAGGAATFYRGLQDRVIIRTSYAEYPATDKVPASRHDDLMVIYAEGDRVRADYYDNEGHVIRYAVSIDAPGKATFVSDVAAGAPRFRLAYVLGADGVLRGEFAIAQPGTPEAFTPYLTWESKKPAVEEIPEKTGTE